MPQVRILSLATVAVIITCVVGSTPDSDDSVAPYLNGVFYGEDAAASDLTVMNLHLLNDTDASGAVCLDGSPGGVYFSKATSEEAKDDWQIYFQGGAYIRD